MLRCLAAGAVGGALVVLATAVAQEKGPSVPAVTRAMEDAGEANRQYAAQRAQTMGAQRAQVVEAQRAVEAHRKRLEREIAELASIRGAQVVLMRYVELGGGGDEEGLDPRLCRESGLRPLCPALEETFGEFGE